MTERSESEHAELVAIADELADKLDQLPFGSRNTLLRRIERALRRLAAQDQKPVAWRTRWRTEGPHEPGDWSYYNQKPPQDHKRYEVEPLHLSPPPAAGWDQAIEACQKIASERDDDVFQDDEMNFIRRQTAKIIARDIEALRHNAPPDSGAGELETELPPLTCDFAQALPGGKLDDSTYSKIEDALDKIEAPVQDASGKWLSLYERIAAIALPDHGGADAGVRPCPFCGANVDQTTSRRFGNEVFCDNCTARAPQDIWNARAISKPAPVAANASAEPALNWQLSDDAKARIAEIDDNRRNAALNASSIVAGSSNASAVLQNDLAEMLRALGMSDAAQPKSPHEVFQSALAEMKRQLTNASAENYRDAIDEALVTRFIGVAKGDARAELNQIIKWEVAVALDPRVSSSAQALIDSGRNASAEARLREALGAVGVFLRVLRGSSSYVKDAYELHVTKSEYSKAFDVYHSLTATLSTHPHASDCDKHDIGPVQHWAVNIHVNGVQVLNIESECLSGIPNIDDYADVVRNCANHLLSFIGDEIAESASDCDKQGEAKCPECGGSGSIEIDDGHFIKCKCAPSDRTADVTEDQMARAWKSEQNRYEVLAFTGNRPCQVTCDGSLAFTGADEDCETFIRTRCARALLDAFTVGRR